MRCTHTTDANGRRCDATAGVRPYVIGPRCPTHSPAALANIPEPGARPTPLPRLAPVIDLATRRRIA